MENFKKYVLCAYELKKIGETILSDEIKFKALEISRYNHLVKCATTDINIDLLLD